VSGRSLKDVQVFELCDVNGTPYTEQDLRSAARNFADFKHVIDPPFVCGHEEDQPLNNTGVPSFGWVSRLDYAVAPDRTGRERPTLIADVSDVHDGIAKLIDEKRYKKVSAEMWRRPPAGAFADRQDILDALGRRDLDPDAALAEAQQWAPAEHQRLTALHDAGKLRELPTRDWLVDFRLRDKFGAMFRRLAALGGELPRLSRLTDLPQTTFSHKPPGQARDARLVSGDEEYEVFMATDTETVDAPASGGDARKAELTAYLEKLGWSDNLVTKLMDAVPTAKLNGVVLAALEQGAGIHDEATGDVPAEEAPPVDEPIADEGATPDTETMIADLIALGEDEATLRAMSPEELAAKWQEMKGSAMSHRTPAPAKRPAATPDARMTAWERRQAQLEAIQRKKLAAEKQAVIDATLKAARDRGALSHSDVNPESTKYNVRARLQNASVDKVVKFSGREMTEFEAEIEAVNELPQNFSGRRGEMIQDSDKTQDAAFESEMADYIRRHKRTA
jgi:hypothetical protein